MSFLTVEDVNSASLNHINEYYVLDTSNISEQGFNGVLYDFIIVSHEIRGNNHTFTFEIHNSLWTGGYYFTKTNGEYLNLDATLSQSTITVETEESSLKLVLYLSSLTNSFSFNRLTNIFSADSIFVVDKSQIGSTQNISMKNLTTNEEYSESITIINGVYQKLTNYYLFLLKKTNLIFDLSDANCKVGVVNQIGLNVDEKYLPGGSLVDEDILDIQIIYNNTIIPVYYDEELNDYCFYLDLVDKINDKDVKVKIIINEIDLVSSDVLEYIIPCNYQSASNFTELQSKIVEGSGIIEITSDINFDSNLILSHDLFIIGNNHDINLNKNTIIIQSDIIVKFSNCNFNQGNPCFIQNNNSKIVLNNCAFANASIGDNYKGSVLSSEYGENIIAEISNCTFTNCHHTIYYGGDLTITKSKALFNIWNESIDTDYSAFLTAYGGTVEIINSIFDIDYDISDLCSNEIDIKFAESLISLGEDTIFNGANINLLNANDSLPFFDMPYNNRSHLFVRYFYPQINSCVISSPALNYEDKSVCHTILGTDWVYKNNVKVSRVEWQSENEIRKIDWR